MVDRDLENYRPNYAVQVKIPSYLGILTIDFVHIRRVKLHFWESGNFKKS